MDYSPKQYLLLYALIILPIVISFFIRRRNAPTRLNLTGRQKAELKREEPSLGPSASAPKAPPAPDPIDDVRARPPRRERTATATPRVEKALNVFFQWNGHSWDAYEVLGVPAGSSRESVQTAYNELLMRSGSDVHEFYKAAYDSIMRNS